MIKFFNLIVNLAFLSSCNLVANDNSNENGEQHVLGYFIKEDAPKICTLRFHLEPSGKREIYRIIDDNLPKFTFEAELLVTGIGYGQASYIDLSAPEFCQYADGAKPSIKLLTGVARNAVYHGEYKKVELDYLLQQFGMDSIALQDPRMRSSKCAQEFEVDHFLDPIEANELRSRYAIPIFAHSLSKSGPNIESIFLFEGQCEKSKEFLSDIIYLGFPREDEIRKP